MHLGCQIQLKNLWRREIKPKQMQQRPKILMTGGFTSPSETQQLPEWGKKRKLVRRWSCTKHNPSTLWKNVKTWLNWNNSGPPSQLFHNGMLVSSPAGLARTMNKFFIDKVTRLINGIPASNNDPLAKLKVQVSHHVESCQGCPNSEERWHTCTQELQTSSPLASVQQDIGENSVQPVSEVLGWSEAHTP